MTIECVTKEDCCGCKACGDCCPKQAISFETDIEGFWYPKVDENCIDCSLCVKICPAINIDNLKKNDFAKPENAIAAINKNMQVRWNSTSGGAFSALAKQTYDNNGYVGGALYTDNFAVKNYISNNPADLEKLRSSKYLQSDAAGLYKEIKQLLDSGERVLVCGTPCQMAALRAFLRKPYENLIILDFVCRGVNSPKVYRKYLDSLEEKYGSKITFIKAKNKELGWRSLTRKVVFENGQSYYGYLMDDDFRRGYHSNVYCRPSCYTCKYMGFPRISDITLGDFWGIENYDKNLDNNIGTSLILLNSKKGKEYFEVCSELFEYKKLPLDSAFKGNVALFKPISSPKIDRTEFFKFLNDNTFEKVVEAYFPKKDAKNKSEQLSLKTKLMDLLRFFKQHKFNLKFYHQFYYINFRTNTFASWNKKLYLIPTKNVTFDIHPTAKIHFNSSIIFGNSEIQNYFLPSCLKMGKDTTLIINPGPVDRYNNKMYNLRHGACIEIVNGGTLTIGQGASNVGLTIMCAKSVSIGNGVRIGRNVSIRDWNGPHVIINDTYSNHAPVKIEDHVWLCSGCNIMPGVTVGKGSVVGANAVVTKDVPPYSLVVGAPAKVVRSDIEWY